MSREVKTMVGESTEIADLSWWELTDCRLTAGEFV